MRSIVGEATLDEYNLLTLITEIERILNDRPITALRSHPNDLSALTPAMIVTGFVAAILAVKFLESISCLSIFVLSLAYKLQNLSLCFVVY